MKERTKIENFLYSYSLLTVFIIIDRYITWHIVTKYPAGFLFIEISGLSVFICIFVVFKRRIVDRILLCGSLSWQDHGLSFVVCPFSF